jgi:GT2 family glycosyltransferase
MDASIVIPTYNRQAALVETLRGLLKMDYPTGRWEAVVVDDGSTDGTEEAVQGLVSENIPVRYLRQANAGPAAARNHGAAEARGRILIFIDNDILVPANFLQMHLETLDTRPGCWVVGRIIHPPELRETPFGRYRDAIGEAFHAANGGNGLAETAGMTAANLSLPAADFRHLGGFDTDFTIASCEDAELGIRARQTGVRILYHPGIVVVHNDWAVSLERFCERQRLYSRSDVILWHKYGNATPRARLVRENSYIDCRVDSARLMFRKTLKRLLMTPVGRFVLHRSCRFIERLAPDTRCNRRLYELAVGVAIFRGVREGLQQYGSAT